MTESLEAATLNNELADRLARARAERARLEEQRAKAEEQRALLEQVEAEELALANARAIEAAEAAHGPLGKRIAAVETSAGVVIVKRPHAAQFRRFQNGKDPQDDALALVRPNVVHPDRAAFDQLLEELPGSLASLTREACRLAGAKIEETTGK